MLYKALTIITDYFCSIWVSCKEKWMQILKNLNGGIYCMVDHVTILNAQNNPLLEKLTIQFFQNMSSR